jgi:hypothetical protein
MRIGSPEMLASLNDSARRAVADADIADLEETARIANEQLAQAKAQRIAECVHPLNQITLSEGSMDSMRGGWIERELFVQCTCGLFTKTIVRFAR